jgi:hypothetical protein
LICRIYPAISAFFVIDSGGWLVEKLFSDGAQMSLASMSDEQKILL